MNDNKNITDEPVNKQYDISHSSTPHVVNVQKSPIKKIVLSLVIILLVAGNVVLGYLYYQQSKKIQDYKKQVQELMYCGAKDSVSGPINSINTEYEATVGKFKLSLPGKYAVVVQNDGVSEGGPSTIILVGEKSNDNSSVIIAGQPDLNGVSITAVPKSSWEGSVNSLEQYAKGQFDPNESLTEIESVEIAGQKALVYSLGGFGYDEYYFFESEDTYYKIKVAGADPNQPSQALDDIKSGITLL